MSNSQSNTLVLSDDETISFNILPGSCSTYWMSIIQNDTCIYTNGEWPSGRGYRKLYHQESPAQLVSQCHTDDCYVIDGINFMDFRNIHQIVYEFKIVWTTPNGTIELLWKQNENPMEISDVDANAYEVKLEATYDMPAGAPMDKFRGRNVFFES